MKLKLKYQLVIYYFIIIAIVISAFSVYILQKQRGLNLSTLRKELISFNEDVYKAYEDGIPFEEVTIPDNLRFSIIDTNYNILYFSENNNFNTFDSKEARAEIIEASLNGEGTALRFSSFSNKEHLYFARKYPEFYIRTSTPYQFERIEAAYHKYRYQYSIIILILFLLATLVYISNKLTTPLTAFNNFFNVLKSKKKDFSQITFPNNEYGDVGRKIIDTYKQLEQAKKFKQQITHNIAHELKTPLTGIRAYLETILNDKEMSLEQMTKFIEKAHKQTLRLSALVHNVSTLNKLDEESEYDFKIEDVNISECLKEIEEELAHKLAENNTTFNPLISSELSMKGNRDLMYSLFKNLIDNTLEHAGPNTAITIMAGISQASGEPSYRINFTYMDNGKGIPEEALGHLFDRFYRVEEGRGRKSGGSGLGLSIVKSSVLFHKGSITVENNPEGGSIFKFNLMSLQ